MDSPQQLSLCKGDHQYVFRYSSGQEPEIIGVFAELASDERCDFDWFDAAVLSYQMGRRLDNQLNKVPT